MGWRCLLGNGSCISGIPDSCRDTVLSDCGLLYISGLTGLRQIHHLIGYVKAGINDRKAICGTGGHSTACCSHRLNRAAAHCGSPTGNRSKDWHC